jgi:predicted lipoprotein with Yx(FWY)xxD motif
MENPMKSLLSARTLTLGLALGVVLTLVAAAQARDSSHSRSNAGTVVALRKTALGTILVDARGRTLYLFEKDRGGVSRCDSACATYWPPLASHGTPRAVKGVRQSLLRVARPRNGVRQVTYAGHPLYTFAGDKRAGQTTGEGLDNFGAEWYALAADGHKVDKDKSEGVGNSGSSSSSGSYGGW